MVESEGSVLVDLGDEGYPDVDADVADEMEAHAHALVVVGELGVDTVVVGVFLCCLDEVVTEAFGCGVVDELQNPDGPSRDGIYGVIVVHLQRVDGDVESWVDVGHEQGEVEVMEGVKEVGVPGEVLHLEDCLFPEGDAVLVCVEGCHEWNHGVLDVRCVFVGLFECRRGASRVGFEHDGDIEFGREPFSVEVAPGPAFCDFFVHIILVYFR